jgi:hypothetical protein
VVINPGPIPQCSFTVRFSKIFFQSYHQNI